MSKLLSILGNDVPTEIVIKASQCEPILPLPQNPGSPYFDEKHKSERDNQKEQSPVKSLSLTSASVSTIPILPWGLPA
jgi:hypothetical protein